MKSLLGKGGTTDFLVRQWGIRRIRKPVVTLNQRAGKRENAVNASLTRRVTIKSTIRYASGWDTAICRSPNRAIEADAI
jgi:hypothetical protein